jgi:mono/diheme cytochrome c family protein
VRTLFIAALVLSAAACSEKVKIPDAALKLADGTDASGKAVTGTTVSVEQLQEGQLAFMHYCFSCHDLNGDGHGPAAYAMRPPPRDFRIGLFKFAGAVAGQVPTDEALERTVRRGLQGTPMLPWDISDQERKAVVQFIKSFKCVPKGSTDPNDQKSRFEKEAPVALEISPDPWKGKEAQAIELGKTVYHVTGTDPNDTTKVYAGCASCHAAYITKEEMYELSKKATGTGVTEFREDLYRTTTRDSEYGLTYDETCTATKPYKVLPPDFFYNKTKSVWPVGTVMANELDANGTPHTYTAEDQRLDLYRVIAGGIGGAAMPQWKGTLPEEHLWALAYYVQTLINLREQPAAYALRDTLDHQPEFKAPDEAPPPEKAPTPEKKDEKKEGRRPPPAR